MKNSPVYVIFKISMLLLIGYSFWGCKKTQPALSFMLSPDALAYIQFKTGTYFIYKDSAANKTDSVIVTESIVQPYSFTGDGVLYNSQTYTLVLTEINPGVAATVWLSGNDQGGASPRVQLVSAINPLNYLFQDIATNIPSMVVEGKTYTNINLTSGAAGAPGSPGSFVTSYYWAKGVGLIKRMETNGTVTNTYTLLRNN